MTEEKLLESDIQQKVLPFFDPDFWIGICGICGEKTFDDEKLPFGICEQCATDKVKTSPKTIKNIF